MAEIVFQSLQGLSQHEMITMKRVTFNFSKESSLKVQHSGFHLQQRLNKASSLTSAAQHMTLHDKLKG